MRGGRNFSLGAERCWKSKVRKRGGWIKKRQEFRGERTGKCFDHTDRRGWKRPSVGR